MKRMLIALALATFAQAAQASPKFIGVHTRLERCHKQAQGPEGEDWITYRCAGLGSRRVWIAYQDGARMRLGFGAREHYDGTFPIDADDRRTVEWRGWRLKGRFVPFAVIVPVRSWQSEGAAELAVFALKGDVSCYVGAAPDIASAYRLVETTYERFTCEDGPEIIIEEQSPLSHVGLNGVASSLGRGGD